MLLLYLLKYSKNMKKLYSFILFCFTFSGVYAQICQTCTSTITGNNSSPQLVTSGQTLCISEGATVSGNILVQGGKVCNAGTITSQYLHVTEGGIFENTASIDVDSLLVSEQSSFFHNRGTIICERIAFTGSSEGINYGSGTIECNYMSDSAAGFINYGNIHIDFDFSNTAGELFQNAGFIEIGRDFYNASGASFQTFCMVNVVRDWYNSAFIAGTFGGPCGGFSIGNDSYNSGTITSIDICDQNTPNGQLDANTGTVNFLTYCACNNNCQEVTSIEEPLANNLFTVYPNPANEKITVETKNNFSGIARMQIFDGKLISEQNFYTEKFEITVENFANGLYLLTLYSEQGEFVGAKRISVVR